MYKAVKSVTRLRHHPNKIIIGFMLLAFFLIAIWLQPSAYNLLSFEKTQNLPIWWEILILLNSDGNYRVDEGESSYLGRYRYGVLWTGCMEKDEEDFLLYHENWELLQWEAQESSKPAKHPARLFTKDFTEKPYFEFNYILKKEDGIQIDFQVHGFNIPQNKSLHKYLLALPASEENSKRISGSDYNSFVNKGSNRIILDSREIFDKVTEKTFNWSWKCQESLDTEKIPRQYNHSHDVKVKITVIPHYEQKTRKG